MRHPCVTQRCGLWRAFVVLVLVAFSLMTESCAPIPFKAGREFDPTPLGMTLKAGTSTMADVQASLGVPDGQGRAQMPFHDGPRIVWTYFSDKGVIQLPSDMNDERQYLFVYFDGERLDGWFWFGSKLSTAAKGG